MVDLRLQSLGLMDRRRLGPAAIVAGLSLLLQLTGCGDSDETAGEDLGGFQLLANLPEAYALGSVWSFGPSDVWLTADSGRVLHFDGSSWDVIQLETNEMMVDIWAFGPSDIWMVGGQTLAQYDGANWTLTNLNDQNQGIESVSALWGSAPDVVWVVGSQSTAAHWDGTTWDRYIAAGTDNTTVWGSGPDDVYVAGIFAVAHWDGTDWQELDLMELGSGAESIWGFGPDDLWIADGSDRLAHFDGSDWSVVELDFTAEAATIWGLGPKDIWGVGTPGGVLHYDGTWREVGHQKIGNPYLRLFHDVHGSPAGDVWIVGTELGEEGSVPQLFRRNSSE
jgi:hypothetical protein